MRFMEMIKEASKWVFSFNSLYEILPKIEEPVIVEEVNFQFSLWDSAMEWYVLIAEKLSFNSLYEIPEDEESRKIMSEFIAFNSLYEIPITSIPGVTGIARLSILFMRFHGRVRRPMVRDG